jgi:hypothetical protein
MKSNGICIFCKKTFFGNAMGKHLRSCSERSKANQSDKGQGRVFLIKAGAGPFWAYFEADGSATLKKVDGFLRDLWLECCGHMSAFTIGNTEYVSHLEPGDCGRSMDAPLEDILLPGLKFGHEYDFGTPTILRLDCISERKGKVKSGIRVLARNNPPDFRCHACGKPAKEICAQCIDDGDEYLLCGPCAKKHKCGEEMLLPVVNSPRMGMCGYTGED